jgi:trk system potassium uptake protein TrkH
VWWPFRHRVFETPVRRQLSLNSRIVLATTLLLVVIGTAAFQATEARHALADRASSLRWLTSLFHSVSARTAGFNSVDVGSLQAPTLLFLTVLMVVGASPLSTGGGVRTTTVAIAALAVRAMTRNREHVEAFGRSIALSVVNACIAITVMYGVALLSVTSALLATQSGCSLEDALFESASALSTVGLSTGLTTELDTTGRWILCGAMIAGRIGPLAVLWSFFTRPAPLRYRYPQEAVIVG